MKISHESPFTGKSFPIGPTVTTEGVNFCLFSKHAERVDLLLFDKVDDVTPAQIITLDPVINKTYHYWHVFVPMIKKGQLYGYRVAGPDDPANGHRFDADKILLDPYGRSVAIPKKFKRAPFAAKGKISIPSMKSVVCDVSDMIGTTISIREDPSLKP